MTDDAMMECSVLIRVKVMMGKLVMGHLTDGVDEVMTVEILEPVLVRIMSVGMVIEVHCRRISDAILVTSVL